MCDLDSPTQPKPALAWGYPVLLGMRDLNGDSAVHFIHGQSCILFFLSKATSSVSVGSATVSRDQAPSYTKGAQILWAVIACPALTFWQVRCHIIVVPVGRIPQVLASTAGSGAPGTRASTAGSGTQRERTERG